MQWSAYKKWGTKCVELYVVYITIGWLKCYIGNVYIIEYFCGVSFFFFFLNIHYCVKFPDFTEGRRLNKCVYENCSEFFCQVKQLANLMRGLVVDFLIILLLWKRFSIVYKMINLVAGLYLRMWKELCSTGYKIILTSVSLIL